MIRQFLLMFIVPVVCAYCNDQAVEHIPRDPESLSVVQVVIEQADSIEYVDKERLYLKAENIFHTNAGLVLYNGHSTILLPRLSVDQSGYYLCRRNKDETYKCTNPKCGFKWSILEYPTVNCPKCGRAGE